MGRGGSSARDRLEGRVERRRAQFRPATSVVSALSSIVANGRQVMLTFPPPPYSFRKAGFPRTGVEPVSVLTIDTNPPSASRRSGTNPSNAECGMGNPGWCHGGDGPAVAIRSASDAQPRQKRGYSLEQRGKARLLEMRISRARFAWENLGRAATGTGCQPGQRTSFGRPVRKPRTPAPLWQRTAGGARPVLLPGLTAIRPQHRSQERLDKRDHWVERPGARGRPKQHPPL